MQSSRSRLMLVALFGVLALGAFTAAAAQAVEAPRWSIGGTILTAGKTHFITVKSYSNSFTLTTAGNVIACTGLNLKAGSLLGSEPGNAGKNNEAIEFTGCTVTGPGITNCTVESPASGVVLTVPIRSELVETEKAEPANKKGSLLTLFEPEVGTVFATLKFKAGTGGKCPVETKVAGKAAGRVFTDPNKPPELGTLVTLEGGATEATSWLVNFPTTPIARVTRISGGVASEITVKLEAFSETAVLEGTALILLAKRNAKGELETEATNWSPLP
jgi:hypothetical protein